MPYICVNTSMELTQNTKDELVSALGKKIDLIPGKSEPVLMVDVCDRRSLYFAGKQMKQGAFVEVLCYKAAPFECNKAFTEAVYQMLKDVLGLEANEIYISIDERPVWGTRGSLK